MGGVSQCGADTRRERGEYIQTGGRLPGSSRLPVRFEKRQPQHSVKASAADVILCAQEKTGHDRLHRQRVP